MNTDSEKNLQEGYSWARSQVYHSYNAVVGHYQAKSCMEYARGDSLLDMPCGDGTLTALLAPAFRRVVCVDASCAHLELARKNVPHAEFHEALIEDLSIEESFDTVTMINALEHVQDPIEVLRKAASMLNPTGVLIVHVPNAQAVNRRLAVLMGTLTHCEELSPFDLCVAGHRRSYSLKSLCRDVEKSGLRLVDTGGVFYKALSTPQMDWFLENGLWNAGYGWGRTGMETSKDWREEFCRASYEYGKEHPEDCNIVFAVVANNLS